MSVLKKKLMFHLNNCNSCDNYCPNSDNCHVDKHTFVKSYGYIFSNVIDNLYKNDHISNSVEQKIKTIRKTFNEINKINCSPKHDNHSEHNEHNENATKCNDSDDSSTLSDNYAKICESGKDIVLTIRVSAK